MKHLLTVLIIIASVAMVSLSFMLWMAMFTNAPAQHTIRLWSAACVLGVGYIGLLALRFKERTP